MTKKKVTRNRYGEVTTSFSGADIIATIKPCNGKAVVIGEVQTISYSTYRPMVPVYALGTVGAKGFTQGHRTVAGSIIFTVFDRHVLKNVVDNTPNAKSNVRGDEMPPFDLSITFLNEYGNSASMTLYGVKFITEGQTMSIEDMITENTMQYMAMDIDLMDGGEHKSKV